MGASRRHSASFWWVLRGAAEGVQGGGPARIRPGLAGKRRERPDGAAVLGAAFPQRRGARQLQGAGQGVAERLGRELHPASRAFEQSATSFDLRLQVFLAFAGRFELLGRDALLLPGLPVEIRRLDLPREALRVPVADAAAKTPLDVVVDHLGEAAELALDGLGLPHQHFEHAVLFALREHEVVANDLWRGLELAVDAPVALLDPPRVPGQVEVEEVGAVGLEVQPFAGGVGGEQDAQGVARGIGVEAALDLLALRPDGLAVDGLDALLREVGAGDGLLEHLAQVALRADDVLREDEHPALVPVGWGGGGGLVGRIRLTREGGPSVRCGRDARAPGRPPCGCRSPVRVGRFPGCAGLRPACERDARAPRWRLRGCR